MKASDKHSLPFLLQLFILCLLYFMDSVKPSTINVSAFYVFGDSTVDPGNNNYIYSVFKSNFPPYGMDFANQVPTGRFTNGKLTTDFIVSYVGLKQYLPPYLDPTLSNEELMTGVSFASAGSGFDPLTPTLSNVIPLSKQLEYFKECKHRLESFLGKQGTENHMQKAVFFISAGTNDFVLNYFILSIRTQSYSVFEYQQFLTQLVKEFIQGLWEEGARKIAVAGLPPMGCLPMVRTLHPNKKYLHRGCIDEYSSISRDYNPMLQQELHLMQFNLFDSDTKLYYIDIYEPFADMIQGHGRLEFEDVDSGCCGTGNIEASFLCNEFSYVCPDRSKFVFWDSIHPMEKAYHNLFVRCRSTIDFIIKN